MLNYVTSNFGLSVVIALVSSLVLYMLNKNQTEQISYMVYLKHSAITFVMIYGLLYYKSSGKVQMGGSISTGSANLESSINIGQPNF